jgi:MFS family permease
LSPDYFDLNQERETDALQSPRQGIFYGWWLTGIAAFVMVIGTVPIFQGMTAWFVVLEQQFGWSRAQLSLAFSLTRAEGTVMGPVAGYLVDKVGARRMVLSGLLVMGFGFLLFSRVNNLWQFYGAFVLASMGAGFGTWLP